MTRTTRVRHFLDNWRFWMTLFGFGLIGVIVALWINYSRVSTDQVRTARVAAARHADIVANADAQYIQCVRSIPVLRHVNSFIDGVKQVDLALLTNTITSHEATPSGSALYAAQKSNIARLRAAIKAAAQVAFPIPTSKSCRDLRDQLTSRD